MNKSLDWLRTIVLLLSVSCATPLFAHDSIPGAPQTRPIALLGGTIYPVSSAPIEQGIVLFAKGRIVAIGKELELPEDVQKIDVTGKRVYPGLFDAHTNLGLVELPSVRASIDDRETGAINPNVEAIKAVHPESELIPVTRSNGVLLALTAPTGTLLTGRASVIQLDGWTWSEMALKTDVGMHLHWPNESPTRDWRNPTSLKTQLERRDELLKTLRQAFDDAAAYRTAHPKEPDRNFDFDTFPRDLRWEAMLPVLDRKQPLIVGANQLAQIQAAVAFAQRYKLKLIIHGGYDAELCADLLKKHEVPVIIEGVYRLPLRQGDDYDAPFTLPERLRAAGVTYCIAGGGKHSTENTRNLPYHAAQAVAFGLPAEEALRAITLSPAEILGVADRVGSLEVGKDATLFVADGDILETAKHVEHAWIQGRAVDLSDRQKRLWHKYQQKYAQ
jgi:imidazolonepropionase-like amidohydrolase